MTDTRNASPARTAYEAAELIRQLNHETLNGKDLTAPQIHRTVRNLLDLVDRLPQAFEQLAALLAKQQTDGKIRMEDGSSPAAPVTAVTLRLYQAAALTESANRKTYGTPASPLARSLADASDRLSAMGGVYEPDDE